MQTDIKIQTGVLQLVHRVRLIPFPKIYSDVETDDTVCVLGSYEKLCYSQNNEAFWGEQGRFQNRSKNGMRVQKRKLA